MSYVSFFSSLSDINTLLEAEKFGLLHRIKLSVAKKGKSRPTSVKKKISNSMKGTSNFEGQTHSSLDKQKISDKRGHYDPIKGKKWYVRKADSKTYRKKSNPSEVIYQHGRVVRKGKGLEEELVNYNNYTSSWQVRHDKTKTMKYEHPSVFMKHVSPHIDYDAHEDGKRVYAYLHGTESKKPNLTNHVKREVKFNRGSLDKPFVHADDNSKVEKADYVEFKGNKVHAYYKRKGKGLPESTSSRLTERVMSFNQFDEAYYVGNIGIHELTKFYKVASKEHKDRLKKHIANGDHNKAWDLVKKVTEMPIHKSAMAA